MLWCVIPFLDGNVESQFVTRVKDGDKQTERTTKCIGGDLMCQYDDDFLRWMLLGWLLEESSVALAANDTDCATCIVFPSLPTILM